MTENPVFLESKRIYLKPVELSDVGEDYLRWMNDTDIIGFTEVRFRPQTAESIRRYVESVNNDPSSVFLGIVVKKGNRYIGNIKLGPINWIHRLADIALIIGEKDQWGKGYGLEALRLMVDHAFKGLNLHKVTAGMAQDNKASLRLFEKAGFKREGVKRKEYHYNGVYRDVYRVGLINPDYKD